MNILKYLRDFYTGTVAMLFTLVMATPAMLVAAYLIGWAVKLIVWAFKLAW
jgi:hypothetical protein